MFRFYVEEKNGDRFDLSKETLKHIKVARATNKEFICVYKGEFFVCRLEEESALIVDQLKEFHDFEGEVIVAAGFINVKRFEWLIQKATELGATKLIPVISENTSTKIPQDIDKKMIRWNEIALNASEQSFRNHKMIVEKPMDFADVIKLKIQNKFIAHEKYQNDVPASFPVNSLMLVGPEGGFSNYEVEQAEKNGVKVVSLGKRILRAETASIFMLARIN